MINLFLNTTPCITEENVKAKFSPEVCAYQNSHVSDKDFFRATAYQPYHLSIGAVLFDKKGRVACHHFNEIFGLKDIYILMRETMEAGETPLMTLSRGLKEEFNASAEPVAFLGGLSGLLKDPELSFNKTTLYFACHLTNWNPEQRNLQDPEGSSIIEWIEPKQLIAIMEHQGLNYKRVDLDESEIIKRALPYTDRAPF